jgi:hypothetical protein
VANTLNVQTHLDARVFADIIRWMKAHNIEHGASYSKVVRLLLIAVQKEHDCAFFETLEEAIAFLESEGFSMAQLKGERGAKTFRALSAESVAVAQAEEEERALPSVDEGSVDRALSLFGEEG